MVSISVLATPYTIRSYDAQSFCFLKQADKHHQSIGIQQTQPTDTFAIFQRRL